MIEYPYLDSWIPVLQDVFASHSQKTRRDILQQPQIAKKKPIPERCDSGV